MFARALLIYKIFMCEKWGFSTVVYIGSVYGFG